MSPKSALFKRIKRHVIGRQHTFFAATSPGLETVCLQELLKLGPVVGKARTTAGGVEFEARLDGCYHANLNLRSASRILMRVDTLKSSNFRQLEKTLNGIPWELYLQPDSLLKVQVTTKHCRLHHSGAIAERFQKAITVRLSQSQPAQETHETSPTTQNIFVRGIDDCFTVSIDSSGDLLYKRGLKKHRGKAPLRETLAAAALLMVGYDERVPLIDPMCGSGTFSLEAALMAKNIPAGWFRDFAFTRWPSFLIKRWDYIRHQSASRFAKPEQPIIFASDIDPVACHKLERCVQLNGLTNAVRVHQEDFFDLDPGKLTDQTGLICINPPYGHRLGDRHDSQKKFHEICNRLKSNYSGWKLVLIAPSRKLAVSVPFPTKFYPILHGGLKRILMVGKIE